MIARKIAVMNPTWRNLAHLPGTVPVAWFLIARELGTRTYYVYAGCYAVVYGLTVAFFLACLAASTFSPATAAVGVFALFGFLGIFLFLATWYVGLRHFDGEQKEIRLRIKYRGAAREFGKEGSLELEDRIKLEYGFVPEHLIPASSRQPTPATRKEEALITEIGNLLKGHGRRCAGSGTGPPFPPHRPSPGADATERPAKIDPNGTDRDVLASHPAIGTTLALEIIRNRQQRGPFLSFDDFCRRCGIKPHRRVALEQTIEIRAASTPQRPSPERLTRKPGKSRRIE